MLLASSVALLFFVGALVGFDRWPGGNFGERVERVQIRPGEEPIGLEDAVAAGTLPTAAGPIAIPVAGAPAPAATPGPGTGGIPVLGDNDSGGTPATPAPGSPPAPANPVGDVAPQIDPGNPATARDVVADTTQRATSELGGAVGQVSPEAGELISGIGGGLAEQLRQVPAPSLSR